VMKYLQNGWCNLIAGSLNATTASLVISCTFQQIFNDWGIFEKNSEKNHFSPGNSWIEKLMVNVPSESVSGRTGVWCSYQVLLAEISTRSIAYHTLKVQSVYFMTSIIWIFQLCVYELNTYFTNSVVLNLYDELKNTLTDWLCL
jgi:hypothetical protein